MKRLFLHLCLVVASLGVGLAAFDADAKRLGGGSSAGMKRTLPPQKPQQPPQQQPPQQAPANAAAPAAAGTTAAAAQAAGKRSWLGPIAGLAAGLGIAALLSHFGLGAAAAEFFTLLLIALVAFFVIRWLMRRFGAQRAAQAAAPAGMRYAGVGSDPVAGPWARESAERAPAVPSGGSAGPLAAAAPSLPANFDAAGFERIAKMFFIRMQAANDAGDLEDLRRFTTPEMYAAARLDLQDRRDATQKTDVVELNAEIVDFTREEEQEVVSVRYHGLVREEADAAAQPFDEVWHLVRPADGSREWAVGGIQQSNG